MERPTESVRLPTQSASRPVPTKQNSSATGTDQKRTKEKKKSAAAQDFRKQLAAKTAGHKKEREKKSDKLLRGVSEFESGSDRRHDD